MNKRLIKALLVIITPSVVFIGIIVFIIASVNFLLFVIA